MIFLLALCTALTLPPGAVKSVIDGDTYALHHVGVGYRNRPEERVRVAGVDTPERGQPGFEEASDSTTAWLARGSFKIDFCERDVFSRLWAWTTRGTDSLHVYLIQLGLGVRTR